MVHRNHTVRGHDARGAHRVDGAPSATGSDRAERPSQSVAEGATAYAYTRGDLGAALPHLVDETARASEQMRRGRNVALLGDTGTGKGYIAGGVEAAVQRSGYVPFITVDCASICPTLITSELFGHVRGAFADAHAPRDGKLRAAHGGYLFLDEFGELAVSLQSMLLKGIEEGRITPVGANRPVEAKFRVIFATHRDFGALRAQGAIRDDLFARMFQDAVIVRLPSLAQCPGAVRRLVGLHPDGERLLRALSRDACRWAMDEFCWPGNLRTFKGWMLRACDAVAVGRTSISRAEAMYFVPPGLMGAGAERPRSGTPTRAARRDNGPTRSEAVDLTGAVDDEEVRLLLDVATARRGGLRLNTARDIHAFNEEVLKPVRAVLHVARVIREREGGTLTDALRKAATWHPHDARPLIIGGFAVRDPETADKLFSSFQALAPYLR